MHEVVLVVAHGTVSSLDELPEFLTRIRHGRPTPAALVAEMRRRYQLVGASPLLEVTREQARLLGERMGKPVGVGMRFSPPAIEDALEELARMGANRVIVLPVAPFSVSLYFEAVLAAQRSRRSTAGLELVSVEPWGTAPELVRAHVEQIRAAAGFASADEIVLTAHSLPLSVIRGGDRYADEVAVAARAIASGLGREVTVAYQSQGSDGEWLGPDLWRVLAAAAEAGRRRMLLAPMGFLSEHVETLYDLDVEARTWASDLGLSLWRVPALGTSSSLVAALAAVVERACTARG
ncbi:MAG: ferrochelatase [Polyangiaceae bacterium]|nr:ferrochelatase [Polyangiaceae bacterium]